MRFSRCKSVAAHESCEGTGQAILVQPPATAAGIHGSAQIENIYTGDLCFPTFTTSFWTAGPSWILALVACTRTLSKDCQICTQICTQICMPDALAPSVRSKSAGVTQTPANRSHMPNTFQSELQSSIVTPNSVAESPNKFPSMALVRATAVFAPHLHVLCLGGCWQKSG